MEYTIDCIGTNGGWKYIVFLWNGNVVYKGTRYYARHGDAERAAKSTGAEPKEKP